MKPSRDSGRAQISHHTEVQGIGKLYRKGVRQGLGREVRRQLIWEQGYRTTNKQKLVCTTPILHTLRD